MTKPIKPSDVGQAKADSIPDAVFEAFNELIVECLRGNSSTVKQGDAVARILAKMPGTERQELFDKGWLDVEDAYRKEGWRVEYDKPGFNEDYEASFTFKRK